MYRIWILYLGIIAVVLLLCVWAFSPRVSLCTMCMQCPQTPAEGIRSLQLEFQVLVSHRVERLLLTAEPSPTPFLDAIILTDKKTQMDPVKSVYLARVFLPDSPTRCSFEC